MRLPVSAASVRPIYLLVFLGLVFSSLAFFPGWMSNDSIIQYREARAGVFNDWHPVLMAWWWRQLDRVYQGPALFLFQNLLMYWGGLGLLANAIRRDAGRRAYLIPLVGFWPAWLFVLGEIWKDVAFACSLFMAWAIILNAFFWQRRTAWFERCMLIVLLSFAVGVKTNGIVAIPFAVAFWLHNEKVRFGVRFLASATLITLTIFVLPIGVSSALQVKHDNSFQYTQVYDLLAVSAKNERNLLPQYINMRVQLTDAELKDAYSVGHNNNFFYGLTGDLVGLRAPAPVDAAELKKSWINAIKDHPLDYIKHRWDLFLSLLRVGQPAAAYVASPLVVNNEFGITFNANPISNWLNEQPQAHPWLFYPWIYLLLTLFATVGALIKKKHRILVTLVAGSSFAFVAPHLIIAPATDFRYLYYSYFCAVIVLSLALVSPKTTNCNVGANT